MNVEQVLWHHLESPGANELKKLINSLMSLLHCRVEEPANVRSPSPTRMSSPPPKPQPDEAQASDPGKWLCFYFSKYILHDVHLGPLLLTWINFNLSMDK